MRGSSLSSGAEGSLKRILKLQEHRVQYHPLKSENRRGRPDLVLQVLVPSSLSTLPSSIAWVSRLS
ncbi:unnamed protein product [Ixodes persulcatus]